MLYLHRHLQVLLPHWHWMQVSLLIFCLWRPEHIVMDRSRSILPSGLLLRRTTHYKRIIFFRGRFFCLKGTFEWNLCNVIVARNVHPGVSMNNRFVLSIYRLVPVRLLTCARKLIKTEEVSRRWCPSNCNLDSCVPWMLQSWWHAYCLKVNLRCRFLPHCRFQCDVV